MREQTERREQPHFTPDDIMLAIDGVQAAGLKAYGVEITLTGSINIATQPLPRQAKTDTQTSANPPTETSLIKKQA